MSTSTKTVAPPPTSTASAVQKPYENNPFMVPIDGLRMLFARAQAIGITLIVLAALGLLGGVVQFVLDIATSDMRANDDYTSSQQIESRDQHASETTANQADAALTEATENIKQKINSLTARDWALLGIGATILFFLALVSWLIGVYIQAMIDYTVARVAKGHPVSFGDAMSGATRGYVGYLWVRVIVGFKVFLWSLLLLIPGLIMAVRYSLAGVSYFDKKLKGNAAVKDSLALTEHGWLTTYASYTLLDMLTFGAAETLVGTSAKIRLYQQFNDLAKRGEEKPAAHILSWLTLLAPFVILFFIVSLGLLLWAVFAA